MQLDPSQELAVDLACTAPFCIITGGPGTGKSTCLRVALDRMEAAGERVALASPTGKAAKRMTEATGRPASTIHRLLEWRGVFTRNKHNPLDVDVVVVDEASMLDAPLCDSLMSACAPETRIIFVGDVDQLPSVGPGRVLGDLVDSGDVPVARLTRVHRAALESWVCRNAPKVLSGDALELDDQKDFRFVECSEGGDVTARIVYMALDGQLQDAQVLTPQRTGACGVVAINKALQRALNPEDPLKEQWVFGTGDDAKVLRIGDKVLQTANNYQLEVFNGEVGVIADFQGASMVVDFGDREVRYQKGDAVGLDLAYALTIHKCVSPDTLVETSAGLHPISEIKPLGTIATSHGPAAYDTFVRNPSAPALRLVCEGGYEVTITPDHRMMVWNGAEYALAEARHIVPGQFLRLKLGATVEPALPGRLPAATSGDVREVQYPVPDRVDADVAEFLGLMVADGTVYRRGFRLAKRHVDVAQRFADLCRKLFAVEPKVSATDNVTTVEVNSGFLARWLLSIGGLGPNQKAIPFCVRASSSELQAAFLRGLFEDGTANAKGGRLDHVEWTTVYPEMARIVQTMLLRHGIICTRSQRMGGNGRAYNVNAVYIYGKHAALFGERIGFVSEWKNQRLKLAVGDETRYRVPVDTSTLGRTTFVEKNAKYRGYVSRAEAANCNGATAAALGFHHVRVLRIEETECESMCVRVPATGRFLQNGFDGSNSQGSEFPWAVVVCHHAHTFMLDRNLLYTGITRAKQGVILVGSRKGLKAAIDQKDPPKRNTKLIERMRAILRPEAAAMVAAAEAAVPEPDPPPKAVSSKSFRRAAPPANTNQQDPTDDLPF